ncbi:hypothetical protein JCM10207_006899 [Rhodosporidiobolus poonsookiae]
MADEIAITTALGSIVVASRSLLASQCRVFADICGIPTPDDDNDAEETHRRFDMTISETESELRSFLAVISGDEMQRKTAVRGLEQSEQRWGALAAMADKYDCELARIVCQSKVWELLYKEESPLAAYSLSAMLNEKDLLAQTPPSAAEELMAGGSCSAGEEWTTRLLDWRARLKLCAVDLASSAHPPGPGPADLECYDTPSCTPFTHLHTWHDGLRYANLHFEATPRFEEMMANQAAEAGLCQHHGAYLVHMASTLDAAWWANHPQFGQ